MNVALTTPYFDPLAVVAGKSGRPRRGHLPLLGVGYLAGALKARGHQVVFVDAVSKGLDVPSIAGMLRETHPDLVGISCISTQAAEKAYALARALREALGSVPLVMGGAHVTSFGGLVLDQCPELDAVIPGEGELVFAELADALAKGLGPKDVRGLIYRANDGTITETEAAPFTDDLDKIPFPDRSIYDHAHFRPLTNLGMDTTQPATAVITSRGCPWNRCRFCFRGGYYQSKYRRRSPENVVAEVRDVVRNCRVRQIKFLDDNFCVNERWVTRFCDLIDRERLGISWAVLGRVDTVTETMLKRMARSGCRSVQYGIESGNQELLDLIDKGITLEQTRRAVTLAKRAGLSVMGFCILGLPTETPAMTGKTVDFACSLNIDYMFFAPYHPFDGTVLAEMAAEMGTFMDNDSRDPTSPPFVPGTYESREQLQRAVVRAYRRYYFRPAYAARALYCCLRRPSLAANYARAIIDFVKIVQTTGKIKI